MPGKISRDPASGELEHFLRGLIVEEFSGREPTKPAIAALAAYVRSIGSCGAVQEQPRSLADQVSLVRQSVLSAVVMAQLGDNDSAAVLVAGARIQLGLIDERYASPGLARERGMLLNASRALQPVAQASVPDPARLRSWLAEFERNVVPRLERTEMRSLYNPRPLARFLGR